jgi:myo-inositol 2-dehydrogenase/D-chiro-inositol 1-dehydrogenase
MEEVRIGFIGCGGNAKGHMRRLSDIAAARIVAVCDLDEARVGAAAVETGGEIYTDFNRMLERDDLDAAFLSLPVFAHGAPELAVIERGLPFLVEKPVARHMDTALEIEAAVQQAGLITCVGYQLRYLGSTDIARNELAGKTVTLVEGRYWCGSGRGDPQRWTFQMEKSGGQLLEQATHTIDLMRFLLGEIKEVSARQTSRQLHQIDCPDVHCVSFEFASGALGSLTTTWAADPLDWSNSNILHVLYDQSMLHLARDTVAITERAEVLEDGETQSQMQTRSQTAPGPNIDQVFVEAVRQRDGAAIRSDYSDAVKTLAVCLGALEAGQSRQTVQLH